MPSISPITTISPMTRREVLDVLELASGPRAAEGTRFTAAPRKAVKDMTAKERFDSLQSRFDANAAKGVDVRFQFELSGSGGGSWYVEIKNGKLTVKSGTGPNPTATLRASAEDYVKIANGEMNKMLAFVRGKLKVDGDKDALKKFDSYFKS